MSEQESGNAVDRRDFIRRLAGGMTGVALVGISASGIARARAGRTVWQIDPAKCTQCGKCETECVLSLSAVKCMHAYVMCGYCNLCFGYFEPEAAGLNAGGENQMCPTGAIKRTFIHDPYYEYSVDEELCVGCGKCVKTCTAFGNGSLYLQVRHDRCLNCNECAIARACPTDAFVRVPAAAPYLRKGEEPGS